MISYIHLLTHSITAGERIDVDLVHLLLLLANRILIPLVDSQLIAAAGYVHGMSATCDLRSPTPLQIWQNCYIALVCQGRSLSRYSVPGGCTIL